MNTSNCAPIIYHLSTILLTVLGGEAFAQNKSGSNDYNLRKAYEVLREENDVEKALDLMSRLLLPDLFIWGLSCPGVPVKSFPTLLRKVPDPVGHFNIYQKHLCF